MSRARKTFCQGHAQGNALRDREHARGGAVRTQPKLLEAVQSHLETKEFFYRGRQTTYNAHPGQPVPYLPSYVEALFRGNPAMGSTSSKCSTVARANYPATRDRSLPIYPCTSCDEAWIQGGDGMLECRNCQSVRPQLPLGLGPPTRWWVRYTPERDRTALATACAITTRSTPPPTPTRGTNAEEPIAWSRESTGSTDSELGEISVGGSFAVYVIDGTQGRLLRQALL